MIFIFLKILKMFRITTRNYNDKKYVQDVYKTAALINHLDNYNEITVERISLYNIFPPNVVVEIFDRLNYSDRKLFWFFQHSLNYSLYMSYQFCMIDFIF